MNDYFDDDELESVPVQKKIEKKEERKPAKKQKEKIVFPYAINFTRLRAYNNNFFLSLDYVVVFEYLLMLSDLFLHKHGKVEFFHSVQKISKGTLLSPYKVNQIIKYFEKHNLLKSELQGVHNVRYFEFNYSKLEALWPKIILKNKADGKNSFEEENNLRMEFIVRNKKRQLELKRAREEDDDEDDD